MEISKSYPFIFHMTIVENIYIKSVRSKFELILQAGWNSKKIPKESRTTYGNI